MRTLERLDEYGNPSGDFSPTFEAADVRQWCKDNSYADGIADKMIELASEATDAARDETATMFWPTAETIVDLVACASDCLLESAEWPPKPAPLPEITEALPREKRRWRKGQMLLTHEGLE